MEPFTVGELFSLGAQHTVESLIRTGEASFRDVSAALVRRFGERINASAMAVAELREQVVNSITASETIPLLDRPNPAAYGINPNAPEPFQYTILARLPDPLNGGAVIEVPWTINSQVPLSFQSILDEALENLSHGFQRPDTLQGAQHADLFRRDLAINRAIGHDYGGTAPLDIEVIGAYRRG